MATYRYPPARPILALRDEDRLSHHYPLPPEPLGKARQLESQLFHCLQQPGIDAFNQRAPIKRSLVDTLANAATGGRSAAEDAVPSRAGAIRCSARSRITAAPAMPHRAGNDPAWPGWRKNIPPLSGPGYVGTAHG